MNPRPITTKKEFFWLWENNMLGNKLRTWRSPEEAVASGVPLVGFREIGKAGAGTFEMATNAEILGVAARWRAAGRDFMVNEAAPDDRALIQGEVCKLDDGWHGLLGKVVNGKRMRDSIKDGDLKPCSGVQVIDLLNRFMDPASRDDLDALLDLYPGHVVEFTCYSVDVGCVPGRATIMWEVRRY